MALNKDNPASINFLPLLLESFGVVNFHRRDKTWKNKIQGIYCYFQSGMLFSLLVFHFLSTMTRSSKYQPHFIQSLTEDIFCISLFIQSFTLNRKYKQLSELISLINDSLSIADPEIVLKYQRLVKKILKRALTLCTFVGIALFLEAFIPSTEEEMECTRRVYRNKYPERKLPVRIMIPFIDETELLNYNVLFMYEFYVVFYIITIVNWLSFVLMPIFIYYIEGQYIILCGYIEKLGSPHYNSDGKEIQFINIETNEYRLLVNRNHDAEHSQSIQCRVETAQYNMQEKSCHEVRNERNLPCQKVPIQEIIRNNGTSDGKEIQYIDLEINEYRLLDNRNHDAQHSQSTQCRVETAHGNMKKKSCHEVRNERNLPCQKVPLKEITRNNESIVSDEDAIFEQIDNCIPNSRRRNNPNSTQYQRNYITRIVKFHQKIITFNEKVC